MSKFGWVILTVLLMFFVITLGVAIVLILSHVAPLSGVGMSAAGLFAGPGYLTFLVAMAIALFGSCLVLLVLGLAILLRMTGTDVGSLVKAALQLIRLSDLIATLRNIAAALNASKTALHDLSVILVTASTQLQHTAGLLSAIEVPMPQLETKALTEALGDLHVPLPPAPFVPPSNVFVVTSAHLTTVAPFTLSDPALHVSITGELSDCAANLETGSLRTEAVSNNVGAMAASINAIADQLQALT